MAVRPSTWATPQGGMGNYGRGREPIVHLRVVASTRRDRFRGDDDNSSAPGVMKAFATL